MVSSKVFLGNGREKLKALECGNFAANKNQIKDECLLWGYSMGLVDERAKLNAHINTVMHTAYRGRQIAYTKGRHSAHTKGRQGAHTEGRRGAHTEGR